VGRVAELGTFGNSMNALARLFRREEPLHTLKRLAQEHDPRGGHHDTLQGASADAVLCLKDEANRNGWLNGGEFHVECLELIHRYLCDGETYALAARDSLRQDLAAIRDAALGGAFEGRFAYEEIDKLVVTIGTWCQRHPKPIFRDPNQDF
jgi:hypothetical protein